MVGAVNKARKRVRGVGPGRPSGSKTRNPGSARFKSAIEMGFDIELVREIGAALNRLGTDPKLRFVTFSKVKSAPFNMSEQRLPARLVKRGREQSEALGVYTVYFPRSIRHAALIVDDEGVRWFREQGWAIRTMADVFSVSTTLLYKSFGSVKPVVRLVEQVRNADEHTEEYRTGIDWLYGRALPQQKLGSAPLTLLELNELLGPGRIARCGAAVMAFREHFGRDPLRVGAVVAE